MESGLQNKFIISLASYFQNIYRTVTSTFTGLHVTASHLFREPITTQYPDRIAKPIKDILPDRYRGFLMVDMDICTACKLCEKDCPIDCIEILTEKNEEKKIIMTQFDIDLAKCMWCGLCTEPCPTGAIHFTPEFERATNDLRDLLFHYIPEGDKVLPYKVPRKKKAGAPDAGDKEEEAAEEARSMPNFTALAFFLFALLTLGFGAIVAFGRNLVYSAFALLGSFTGVAGLYVLLSADFVSVVQIFVYVGGITVLLIFAVMFTQAIGDVKITNQSMSYKQSIPMVGVLMVLLGYLIKESPWVIAEKPLDQPTTAPIGDLLLTKYLLPFELISIVLLVSLIGAIVVARRQDRSGNIL